MLFASKAAFALATKNMFICKPSEQNCFPTIYIRKLLTQASFTPGVMNIVVVDGQIGALLAEHPGVNKISFTSSATAGIKINVAATKTLKRVTLEMSGKSLIVAFRVCSLEIAFKECIVDAESPHLCCDYEDLS